MADLIGRIADAHDRQLRRATDVDVVYSTGDESWPLKATPGRRDDLVDPIEAGQLSARLMDWILRAEDLQTPAGERVTPDTGHTITHDDGRDANVWQVLPDGNDRCSRPADQYGRRVRVHCKLTTSEPS